MPAKVKKLGHNQYIIIDANTGKKIVTSGQFTSRKEAGKQAAAVNINTKGGQEEL